MDPESEQKMEKVVKILIWNMYIKVYYCVYLKFGGSRICGYIENVLALKCYMLKCSWVKFMMFITCSNYSEKKCA